MKKRMILMLTGMAVFIAVLGGLKFLQIKSAIAAYAAFQPPPEAVTTIVAQPERWPTTIDAIGTVAAVRGVTVSADLPGIVQKIAFESGQSVKAGDVLVQLDTRQEQAQMAAADAQRELARTNLDRMRSLLAQRIVAQAEYDQAEADYKRGEAATGEIRATIGRKTIRAPFSGVLGIRQVNLGQYLAGGAPIVSLQAMTPIYVNFAVPQQQAGAIRPGTQVAVTASNDVPRTSAREVAGTSGRVDVETSGKVNAMDSVVDPATRNVEVQAVFGNVDRRLRPGMFVQAKVLLGAGADLVTLPASAINYAPYGDSVFVVSDLSSPKGGTYRGVRQRFVKLGGSRGDQVAILSGLEPGEEVVTSGVFKLRSGAAVQVNNNVQPSNNPAPRPEER